MKKFVFRLDSVLRLRGVELAAEQAKLQKLNGEAARLRNALESIAGERAQALNFVRNQAGADNTELRALSAFLLSFEARLARLRQSLQRVESLIEPQRQRVIAADRNQRLLLKLKEKRLAEWRHETDLELEAQAQESWNVARHFQQSGE